MIAIVKVAGQTMRSFHRCGGGLFLPLSPLVTSLVDQPRLAPKDQFERILAQLVKWQGVFIGLLPGFVRCRLNL